MSHTIRARRVTVEDLPNLSVGQTAYRAGHRYLDEVKIVGIKSGDVQRRVGHGRHTAEVVGQHVTLDTKSRYGGEQACPRLFTTPEAFDAHYPEDGSNGKREQILERLAEFPLFIEDENGDEVQVTDDWGSSATINLYVPGIDADALQKAVTEVLEATFPGALIPKVWTRPVADRRVNVYVGDYQSGEPSRRKMVGMNVLDAMSSHYANASSYFTEYVDEDVIVGK